MNTLETLDEIQWQALQNPDSFVENIQEILEQVEVQEDLLQRERIVELAKRYARQEDAETLGEIRDWGARIAFWLRREEYQKQVFTDLSNHEACRCFVAEILEEDPRDEDHLEELAFLFHALLHRKGKTALEVRDWYNEHYDPDRLSEDSLEAGSAWR